MKMIKLLVIGLLISLSANAMSVLNVKNSVDYAYSYDAGSSVRDVVVQKVDAATGAIIEEKAIASMMWEAGGTLLAPQSPYQVQPPKLIIKIQ
jgi:Flp pilus assembly protein CpaB